MDFIWIFFAFICGLLARSIAMPPLIGYLSAGFALNFLGFEGSNHLETLSNFGITLMLFTIGLKLNVKDMLKVNVWGGTLANMSLWVVMTTAFALLPISVGLSYFADIDMETAALIAFALSFSSTVCIVKILEESGEIKSRHGKLAVGILVMQDVVAVVFMVIATGKLPSIWAIALFGLIFVRKPMGYFLEKAGHGELLPLMGFFLAFGGYELFKLGGVKGDLGALIAGMLLSGHLKSSELYKSLMSFKDIFLIGFFLSIGFTALPNLEMVLIALVITLLIPLKSVLFFSFFSLLNVRARTAFLSSLILGNYSEFGLIVIALCVQSAWMDKEWLVVVALAVSFSFVFTSLIYAKAHNFYRLYKPLITRFEKSGRVNDDVCMLPREARILVIGMGRVGKGTFSTLRKLVVDDVVGMDSSEERVKRLNEKGYRVLFGDGEDYDLWQKMNLSNIELILIALPYIQDIKIIQDQLKSVGYAGKVAAIARHEDQIEQLSEYGIDRIFNFYTEAGVGFAEESLALLDGKAQTDR